MVDSPAPTLEDVARAAGVSTTTISRCINEPDKVASTTRERVEQVITTLGFTPNHGGRALASRRSRTVGAVIPTMANAMFASGLQSFQEVLSNAGYTLLVASSGYNPDEELQQIRSLVSHGADALLLIGTDRLTATTEFLTLRRIPHVIAWSHPDDSAAVYAGFDNCKAGGDMARYLLSLGHRRIAMIAGRTRGNDRARHRVAGVRNAIEAWKTPGDAASTSTEAAQLLQVIESSYELESGGAAFAQLLDQPDPPSAIICGNDVLAAGALMKARELGVRVPEDVSVTGFDDLDLARSSNPSLTTMRVPQTDMGQASARLLLQLLDTESSPAQSIKLEATLVVRESTAKLR